MLYKDKMWFIEQVRLDKTVADVAEACNVSSRTIENWEKKHETKLRRPEAIRIHQVDEDFFENIDSEEKAYILGFIAADGYIGMQKKSLVIQIQEDDKSLLNRIAKEFGYSGEIKTVHKKGRKPQAKLEICSKRMCESLERYSIIQNKTRTVSIPDIPEALLRHYLRGYFDGDGYVGKRQAVLTTASRSFCNSFLRIIEAEFGFTPWSGEQNNAFRINFPRKHKLVIQWLCEDAEISLERKQASYVEHWS